jgi:hypothetical protein
MLGWSGCIHRLAISEHLRQQQQEEEEAAAAAGVLLSHPQDWLLVWLVALTAGRNPFVTLISRLEKRKSKRQVQTYSPVG